MFQIALDSQAATNWLLVIITAVYCFLTYKIVQKNGEMVAQMRAQYESFIAPIVTTTIQLKHGVFIYLKIKNKGQSAAKNLRLTMDKDFYQAGEFSEGNNIRNFPVFQQPIPSFGPDEEIFILFSQGFNLDKKNGEKPLTLTNFASTLSTNLLERHLSIDTKSICVPT